MRYSSLSWFYVCWNAGTIKINYGTCAIIAKIVNADIPVLQRQKQTFGALRMRVHVLVLAFTRRLRLPVSQLVQFWGPSSVHSWQVW